MTINPIQAYPRGPQPGVNILEVRAIGVWGYIFLVPPRATGMGNFFVRGLQSLIVSDPLRGPSDF